MQLACIVAPDYSHLKNQSGHNFLQNYSAELANKYCN